MNFVIRFSREWFCVQRHNQTSSSPMDKFYKNNRRINNHVGKSEKRKRNETNENALLFTMNLPLDFYFTIQKFNQIFHIKHNKIQKTRKHSSRKHTTRLSSPGWDLPTPLESRSIWMQTPKDRPARCGQTTPPGGRLPPPPRRGWPCEL